jgi:hypothetical protein
MNNAKGEEREIKYIIVLVVSNLRLLFSLKENEKFLKYLEKKIYNEKHKKRIKK